MPESGNPALLWWRGPDQKTCEFREKGIILGQFADTLIQRVCSWSGKHSEETLDDDLTLVVADFENS